MTQAEMTVEERNALVVKLRLEDGLTLAEVGQRVGLSGTRIYRILKEMNGDGPSPSASPRPPKTAHRCATPGCSRELKSEHWIYSTHTGLRYCWTGEGCWAWTPEQRAKKRAEFVAPKVETEEVA